MDINVRRELCSLVEDITTSGNSSLDEAKLKAIKNICKKSDLYVESAHTLLMNQIERDHAQIRLSCLLLIDQLFCRSHAFRVLLAADLHAIMTYCIGTDVSQPLPRPREVAETMKRQAIKCFSDWHRKFGEHYKKLALAYTYLQKTKKVDFANLEAQSNQQRREAELRAQRKQLILQRKLDAVKQQMDELVADMERTITEMESCYRLLLPSVEDFEPVVRQRRSSSADGRVSLKSPMKTSRPLCAQVTGATPAGAIPSAGDTTSERCSTAEATELLEDCEGSSSARAERRRSSSVSVGDRQDRTVTRTMSCSSGDIDNFEEWEEDEDCDDGDREDGVGSRGGESALHSQGISTDYTLSLDASSLTIAGQGGYCITENADNSDLLTALADNHRLLMRKFLPMTAAWLGVLTRNAEKEGQRLRQVVDFRQRMTASADKFSELRVTWKGKHSAGTSVEGGDASSEDDDDDEFEEVPVKEGLEATATPDVDLEQALQASRRTAQAKATHNSAKSTAASSGSFAAATSVSAWSLSTVCGQQPSVDPTSIAAQLVKLKQNKNKPIEADPASAVPAADGLESTPADSPVASDKDNASSPGSGLLAVAPKIRFDTDILNWGEELDAPPTIVKLDSLHRFWNNNDTEPEVVNKEVWESANQRSILFTGKFQPVKWTCRAPLPSGKLCPRRDRVKCPFHGPVIARDEQGRPSGKVCSDEEDREAGCSTAAVPVDKTAVTLQAAPAATASWQDLEADVAAAVGLTDTMKSKPARKKRKAAAADSNLVNLDAANDTPKTRLAKRIFNKSSMNRVGAALDAVATKRGEDRFGNQWNYTFGTL